MSDGSYDETCVVPELPEGVSDAMPELGKRKRVYKPPAKCPHGKPKKLCSTCGGSSLCGPDCPNQGKEKQYCSNCGGSALCGPDCPNQGKLKKYCSNCGGSALCGSDCPNQGKRKSHCVTCGGSALCGSDCPNKGKEKKYCSKCGGSALCGSDCPNQGKRKTNCSKCGGSALCGSDCPNQGKSKSRCSKCGGSALCGSDCPNQGKEKQYCSNCGGSALCGSDCPNQGKPKSRCSKCGGSALCGSDCPNQGKPKSRCSKCGGSALCGSDCPNQGKQKQYCSTCGGSALCGSDCPNQGKQKSRCSDCGGKMLCVGCFITIVQKRGDMCRTCAPVAHHQARTREARMAAKLDEWARQALIPRYTLWNRQNPLADPAQCGKYRVDFTFELPTGVVLLEFDEQMHADRVLRCELVRQAEVSLGFGGLPVHWIRFNPDAFKIDGKTRVTKMTERLAELLKQLQNAVAHADYEHPITVTYLCYNKTAGNHDESGNDLVQTHKFKTINDYNTWAESIS